MWPRRQALSRSQLLYDSSHLELLKDRQALDKDIFENVLTFSQAFYYFPC